ncbi:enoyl-CoA hydratase-related protein [Nocardia sp. NBC_00508]|uniref:enoyl-CoA hydratase-related protein n=1 Tax=Nocardia sp. NBC_00508 TaxID=2975992 RepID=UPI002E822E91|nr:enoyl-CoA hydratase-related protein [Nocardia sp. NBC_00508]WUD66371.1 enoyl-CoA hydratase-related protein [Nocardia sp. NBC_00508]
MTQRVLILASANNGLTQRAALAVRRSGRTARISIVHCESDIRRAVESADFDIVVCPYLTTKIPADIYRRWTCVILHPGPVGDRGPHSLDWAISEREPLWGVTALTAAEEMDAGPIWSTRTFGLPWRRKSAVYNTVVADAAIECLVEALDKADRAVSPTPQAETPQPIVHARRRPAMRRRDREVRWSDDTATILSLIHASDGSPGAPATIAGLPMLVYDAHHGRDDALAPPGTLLGRRDDGIEIACGDGSIWVGRLRSSGGADPSCKGPAAQALAMAGFPVQALPVDERKSHEIRYRREGEIGFLTIDFYNGAMGSGQCRRLLAAFAYAAAQDTKVVVLENDGAYFANGIDLSAVELSDGPEGEAWRNLLAINNVCRAILTCSTQVTIAAVTGSAGAGGVMLALTADLVVAADRVVFNPHYQTIGLSGSEFHTYTLPRRVGGDTAQRLLHDCQAIDAVGAADLGLVDAVAPSAQFGSWLTELARESAHPSRWAAIMAAKQSRLSDLNAIERAELRRMARDIFRDENEFRRKRQAFVLRDLRHPSTAGL